MTLKPVDPQFLAWHQSWDEPIKPRVFFSHLFQSWRRRWALYRRPLPLNPNPISRADRECMGCGSFVEQNVHGYCGHCGSENLIYIGRSQVLQTVEQPRILYWGNSTRRDATIPQLTNS